MPTFDTAFVLMREYGDVCIRAFKKRKIQYFDKWVRKMHGVVESLARYRCPVRIWFRFIVKSLRLKQWFLYVCVCVLPRTVFYDDSSVCCSRISPNLHSFYL